MDYLGQMFGPESAGYGTGLYDFGYTGANLPPAQAATSASQLEAGGSGFNWNAAIGDITKAYMLKTAIKAQAAEVPTNYRVNESGQLYATDPAYRGAQTLGGVGSAIGGIPTIWILLGVGVFFLVSASGGKG